MKMLSASSKPNPPLNPPPAPPLAANLIVTPHAAFYSEAAEELSYRLCVARVREVLDGA